MGLALAGILKAAASSLLGNKLKDIAFEKVTTVAREKLGLPMAATEVDIDVALKENPDKYAEIVEAVTEWRMEQERTQQVALEQQGKSERVALQSESGFVRNARPAMIYLGGFSCFAIIMFGVVIAWTRPESLGDFVNLTQAIAMPLTALLTAGGVYAYRRTTDKAIQEGFKLPPMLNLGK